MRWPLEPDARRSGLAWNWRWLAAAAGVVLTLGIGWQFSGPGRDMTEPVAIGVSSQKHHVGAAAGSNAAAREPGAPMGRCAWGSISRARVNAGSRGARGVGRIRRRGIPSERSRPCGASIRAATSCGRPEGRIPGDTVIVSPTFRVRVD